MREFYGQEFFEMFVPPQVVSRKVWVVVLPIGPRNHTKPFKLRLAIYSSCQDAETRTELNLNQPDPSKQKSNLHLAPCNENGMQQLHWFSDACKGIPQARIPEFLHNSQPPAAPATARPNAEDLELAMAIHASIQSAILETSIVDLHSGNIVSASDDWGSSSSTSEWTMIQASSSTISTEVIEIHNNDISAVPPTSIPSAPPATKEVVEDSPIQYQSIGPLFTICMDAPSEAACGPCGHVAGCMHCLNEIKAKKWGCPVCRAKIQQVIIVFDIHIRVMAEYSHNRDFGKHQPIKGNHMFYTINLYMPSLT
ncbi:hypothetical protein V6Z12_A09G261400 [Gossypium hirsutum]